MKMSEEFPSKYLRAADLQGREIKVIMQQVEREQVGQDADDTKPVLYFKGNDKGLVLNKTNATTIGSHYGDDSDDWYDQPLILFSVMVSFQGKTQPAIRCRIPTAKDLKPAQRKADPISSGPQRPVGGISDNMAPQRSEPPAGHPAMDDDIPF